MKNLQNIFFHALNIPAFIDVVGQIFFHQPNCRLIKLKASMYSSLFVLLFYLHLLDVLPPFLLNSTFFCEREIVFSSLLLNHIIAPIVLTLYATNPFVKLLF